MGKKHMLDGGQRIKFLITEFVNAEWNFLVKEGILFRLYVLTETSESTGSEMVFQNG